MLMPPKQAMPITDFALENFRLIRKLNFTPNRINIFVGPNNSGKSTILEGIALLATSINRYNDSLDENVLSNLIKSKEYALRYLINTGAKFAEIRGEILNNNYRMKLEHYPKGVLNRESLDPIPEKIVEVARKDYLSSLARRSPFHNFLPLPLRKRDMNLREVSSQRADEILQTIQSLAKEEIPQDEILEMMREVLSEDALKDSERYESLVQEAFLESEKLVISLFQNDELNSLCSTLSADSKNKELWNENPAMQRFFSKLIGMNWKTPLLIEVEQMKEVLPAITSFARSGSSQYLNMLHDRVVTEGRIDSSITLCKERISYITDIRKTEDDILIFTSNGEPPIPLSQMGDGFSSLLELAFLSTLAENGIVILEEPERSQHPGFLDITAESIVANSDRSQFFMSTHSQDLLESVLRVAEHRSMLECISIVRLHRREDINEIEPEILNGVAARDELDSIGTDLRGC